MENDRKIAVLIDADNVSEKYIKFIFDELSNHGIPTYKRIYGDWTKPQLAPWKNVLLDYSISPIQQYSYTTGKNSTDAALIIDAMDILYSHNVDGFCIVSSDSDFTKLAARLREAGMYVMGMGEKKTPKPFISACEKFKYLEVLASMTTKTVGAAEHAEVNGAAGKEPGKPEEVKAGTMSIDRLVAVIRTIITEISDDDGWAFLGEVGSTLNRRYPDFDTRNYGHAKLTPLVASLRHFEIKSTKAGNSNVSLKYIRNKD
ncbi:MAG: NYN domain-containing protein [Clostridiales bacterium]|nr:NYN domain-containing protein [Clostridiales bacterium]